MTRRNDSYGTVRPDPRRRSFAMTPEALLLDKNVSDRAKTLWGILDRIAAGREQAIGSRAGLAERLNCSPSSLDRARAELEEAGWLGVERVKGEASRYTTHDVMTYPQGVVIYGDTQMGVVTGGEPPSSPVVNGVSSPVTTEERGTSREGENPPPRGGGASACGGPTGNDEAAVLLGGLPLPWNLGRKTIPALAPLVAAALTEGWTERDLIAEITKRPPVEMARPGSVLRHRLEDLPSPPKRSDGTARRTWARWCGTCDGPETRLVYESGESCPDCHPSFVRKQA